MSDIGKLKPIMQTIPIRPINKDSRKKEQSKKDEGKALPKKEEHNSDEHIDELI